MNVSFPPFGIGSVIALVVLIVAVLSLFVAMNIDGVKLLTLLIIGLAVARLT